MNIPSDIERSLINTVYLTFVHNYIAIAYFIGILISIILAIYRPSRYSVILFIGFSLLLFGYEYDKHIINAFREQTLNSLGTAITHNRFQKLVSLIISDLIPVFLYTTGWLFIYAAMIFGGMKVKNKNK